MDEKQQIMLKLQTALKSQIENNPHNLYKNVKDFKYLMLLYRCAIREVKTRLEILNDEMIEEKDRNPIEFVKSRIKKPASLLEKLCRRGFEISNESIRGNINDVAGVRVVCSFIDDIYQMADMLMHQDDIKLVQIKDYIKNPKPNGYRSLHMIVEVPVFFSNKKEYVRCEIQIRTIAMDLWASLEHKMKYKKTVNSTEQILEKLKAAADKIHEVDTEMLTIRNCINEVEDIEGAKEIHE